MSTTLTAQTTKMRRFLRDPDAEIWTAAQIMILWNEAAIEVCQKTGILQRMQVYEYPPEYTYSYLWDWEWAFTSDTTNRVMNLWTRANYVICYPWEASFWMTSPGPADDGGRYTHTWETIYVTPGDVVPIPLHAQLSKVKYMAWDEEQIDPLPERVIAKGDGAYKTTAGLPQHYYFTDVEHNQIVLYPRPSTVTVDDLPTQDEIIIAFEDDGEIVLLAADDSYDESDVGYISEAISAEDQLFVVFESLPDQITDADAVITLLPDWVLKTIMCGVLERAFGMNTDGFVPSLRDYWQQRKDLGIKALKVYREAHLQDRDYRLGGNIPQARSRLRLPAGYPAVYP